MSWQDYLNEAERARMDVLKHNAEQAFGERRKIYNRARQRKLRAELAKRGYAITKVESND